MVCSAVVIALLLFITIITTSFKTSPSNIVVVAAAVAGRSISSSSSIHRKSATTATNDDFILLPNDGHQKDPFVIAAPLTIAVACRDGVAIVVVAAASSTVPTTTTPPSTSSTTTSSTAVTTTTTTTATIDPEPLIYYNMYDINRSASVMTTTATNPTLNGTNVVEKSSKTTTIHDSNYNDTLDYNNNVNDHNVKKEAVTDGCYPFYDIPDTFIGPYRIQSIGTGFGGKFGKSSSSSSSSTAAFVSCGWKADGYIRLLNTAREIIDTERLTFGTNNDDESSSSSSSSASSMTLLVHKLSLYMTQCAISDRLRSLSCTALIGSMSFDHDEDEEDVSLVQRQQHGCLWFIDYTGAYPVRAHCMGGGTITIQMEDKTTKTSNRKTNKLQQQPKVTTKTVLLSDVINRELLYRLRQQQQPMGPSASSSTLPPYYNMTTDEALVMILDMLSTKHINIRTPSNTFIAPQSRLEVLCITSSSSSTTTVPSSMNHQLCKSSSSSRRNERHVRKRISDIWGMKMKHYHHHHHQQILG